MCWPHNALTFVRIAGNFRLQDSRNLDPLCGLRIEYQNLYFLRLFLIGLSEIQKIIETFILGLNLKEFFLF